MNKRHFVLVTLLGLFWVNTLSAQDESQEENVSKESTNVVKQMQYDTRWGLRTNMAYHTLNLTNLGIECNVNNHWGFVADALFPWWEAGDSHRTTKIMSLGLEGRYYWRGCQDANHLVGDGGQQHHGRAGQRGQVAAQVPSIFQKLLPEDGQDGKIDAIVNGIGEELYQPIAVGEADFEGGERQWHVAHLGSSREAPQGADGNQRDSTKHPDGHHAGAPPP